MLRASQQFHLLPFVTLHFVLSLPLPEGRTGTVFQRSSLFRLLPLSPYNDKYTASHCTLEFVFSSVTFRLYSVLL